MLYLFLTSIDFKGFIGNEILLLKITSLISSITLLISNLEWIHLNKHFDDGGIFSLKIKRFRGRNSRMDKLFSFFLNNHFFKVFQWVRLIILILLYVSFDNNLLFSILSIIYFLSLTIFLYFVPEGLAGSEQMAKNTLLVVALCLLSSNLLVLKFGMVFLSIQLIVAYMTPGLYRIIRKEWLYGSELISLLRLKSYGNKSLWEFLKGRKKLAMLLSFGIVLFESIFFLSVLFPFPYVLIFVLLGIIFHLSLSFIMGLNSFTWTFIANYIPLVWLAYNLNMLFINF
jgi:hypothetical protein